MGAISFSMTNSFLVKKQLEELEIGEDAEIVFKKEKLLKVDLDRQTFKKALETIGRKDLATKLDIYVAVGK